MFDKASAIPVNDKSTIRAWCLYDWANSAFTTLVVTFIYSSYFSQTFAPDEGAGTALWSRGIVISSILIALLAPLMGAAADRGGARRRFLLIATLVCVSATALLTFVTPGQPNAVLMAMGLFIIANVAFEVGIVFYNAFLPGITTPDRIGRVSGNGWGLGYAGGLVCLVVALFGFVGLGDNPPLISLSTENGFNVRATNLLVAVWFLLFSVPALMKLRDPDGPKTGIDVAGAFRELRETIRKIREYRQIIRFLFARLIFNDGLITVFAFGGIFAMGTFGFSFSDVIVFGIALNVTAGLGAWLFGAVDDRFGAKRTIMLSLVFLSLATLTAVLAPNRTWFWIGGVALGIFAGPNQSASRSLMARFVPQQHQSEFFGFFAFSGKATAFMGPLLLGILSDAYGQRVGVSVVLLFFLAGGMLMLGVDEQEGIATARGPAESV